MRTLFIISILLLVLTQAFSQQPSTTRAEIKLGNQFMELAPNVYHSLEEEVNLNITILPSKEKDNSRYAVTNSARGDKPYVLEYNPKQKDYVQKIRLKKNKENVIAIRSAEPKEEAVIVTSVSIYHSPNVFGEWIDKHGGGATARELVSTQEELSQCGVEKEELVTLLAEGAPDSTSTAKMTLLQAEIVAINQEKKAIRDTLQLAREDCLKIYKDVENKAPCENETPLQIRLLSPEESSSTVYKDEIKFKFRVDPPDDNYTIRITNLSDNEEVNYKKDKNDIYHCEALLKKKLNQINISVVDSSMTKYGDRTLFVNYERNDFQRKGKDYALLIAINDYDDETLTNLKNPVKNAADFGKLLEEKYKFSVETLKNPSLDSLKGTIRRYAQRKWEKHDQLLIFLTGHGLGDDVFKAGYFAARNSETRDTNRISFYSYNDLQGNINDIGCNNILLMIDACHSGSFHEVNRVYKDYTAGRKSRKMDIFYQMEERTRIAITSTDNLRKAPDESQFMKSILDILRKMPESYYTLSDLMVELDRHESRPIRDRFAQQGPRADFYFIKPED